VVNIHTETQTVHTRHRGRLKRKGQEEALVKGRKGNGMVEAGEGEGEERKKKGQEGEGGEQIELDESRDGLEGQNESVEGEKGEMDFDKVDNVDEEANTTLQFTYKVDFGPPKERNRGIDIARVAGFPMVFF
jgi:hypothetical protein